MKFSAAIFSLGCFVVWSACLASSQALPNTTASGLSSSPALIQFVNELNTADITDSTNLSSAWPQLPYLMPDIINTADKTNAEWMNFTAQGSDLSLQETLSLALIVFEQLQAWILTAWHDPCQESNQLQGPVRLLLTCHKTTPSVVTLVFALSKFMLLLLSWGGKEVTFDFGVGTNYTHAAAQGTFEVQRLWNTAGS